MRLLVGGSIMNPTGRGVKALERALVPRVDFSPVRLCLVPNGFIPAIPRRSSVKIARRFKGPARGARQRSRSASSAGSRGSRRSSGAVSRSTAAPVRVTVRTTTRQQPKQRTLPNGDVVVSHRELLGSINSTGNTAFFRSLSVQINAGNGGLAPWLAALSQQYESYLFKSLRFDYVPYIPTTFAGQVFFTVDYDAGDVFPTTDTEFSVTPGSMNCAASQKASMVCRGKDLCKRAPSYYVRTVGSGTASTATGIAGIRSFDTGNFHVGLEPIINAAGAAYTGKVGAIWVSYDVVLTTPQPSVPPLGTFAVARPVAQNVTAGTLYTSKVSASATNQYAQFDSSLLSAWNGAAPFFTAGVPALIATVRSVIRPGDGSLTPNCHGLSHKMVNAGVTLLPIVAAHMHRAFGLVSSGQTTQEVTSTFVLSSIAGTQLDLSFDWTALGTQNILFQTSWDITTSPLSKNALIDFFGGPLGNAAVPDMSIMPVHLSEGATPTAVNPFGVNPGRNLPDPAFMQYDETTGILTMPRGHYWVVQHVIGTVITAVDAVVAGTNAVTVSTSGAINVPTTIGLRIKSVYFPDSTGGSIDFSVTATTVTSCDVIIMSRSSHDDYSGPAVVQLPL